MWAAIASCAFSILGTHSRGAFLAIGVAALFLGFKSGRPILTTALLVIGLAGAAMFMPDNWTIRMGTIETYENDASAVSRLQTWEAIWNMAIDRPIFGAGFDFPSSQLFETYFRSTYFGVFAPHSIYFQVLGEHGFVGLALYLALGVSIWRRGRKLALECMGQPDLEWVPILMRMVQVSLLVFATGGAFLGLLHYDLPYYLAAIVVLVEVAIADEKSPGVLQASRPVAPSMGTGNV